MGGGGILPRWIPASCRNDGSGALPVTVATAGAAATAATATATATQVDFYVLSGESPADKLHYACRLTHRARERGLTVYLHTADAEQNRALDEGLWTFSQEGFVPHAVLDDAAAADNLTAERYPVLIGSAAPPDGFADLLISLRPTPPPDHARFARIAELITAHAADKAAGRERFRYYRDHGITPRTHQIG